MKLAVVPTPTQNAMKVTYPQTSNSNPNQAGAIFQVKRDLMPEGRPGDRA